MPLRKRSALLLVQPSRFQAGRPQGACLVAHLGPGHQND